MTEDPGLGEELTLPSKWKGLAIRKGTRRFIFAKNSEPHATRAKQNRRSGK